MQSAHVLVAVRLERQRVVRFISLSRKYVVLFGNAPLYRESILRSKSDGDVTAGFVCMIARPFSIKASSFKIEDTGNMVEV